VTDLPVAGTTTAEAQLDGAVWVAAELDEVALESSSLRRLRGSGGAWTRSSFIDCAFDGADLAGLVTSDCSLVRCTVDGARLTGSQWLRSRWRAVTATDVVADGVSAHGSTWTDVTVTGGRWHELDLTDARLERVAFLDCDLRGARFHAARCVDVRLLGCRLDGVVGVGGLRAATLGWSDAVGLLPSLARELGITVLDDDARAAGG
jgi:uncharacterized protein YjbI with pentapeptide repeats